MKKIKIKVTQECIEIGDRGNITSCPIALALCNQFNTKEGTYRVGTDTIGGPDLIGLKPPRSAQRFIKAFDKGKEVKPFNFMIEIP